MRVRFDEQLERLNVMLIDMGALCEEAITYAVKAFGEKRPSAPMSLSTTGRGR